MQADARTMSSIDVASGDPVAELEARLGELWRTLPAGERLGAIEYFLAGGPNRPDHDPEEDGDPRNAVERLAKRLNMRPVFLLKDRRRAAKMLEQYGHSSLGALFTYRATRAYVKQHHPATLAVLTTTADELSSAREDGDEWDPEAARSALQAVRLDLPEPVPDAVWELLLRAVRYDWDWQGLVTKLVGDAAPATESESAAAHVETAIPEPGERSEEPPGALIEALVEVSERAATLEPAPADDQRDLPAVPEVSVEEVSASASAAEAASELEAEPVAQYRAGDEGRTAVETVDAEFSEDVDDIEEPEPVEPPHRLTGLDHAIMDFILATVTETPGSKTAEEVLRACNEWSRLSTHRVQSYYCLGLAHGLLDDSIDGFARTEMSEARNAWYAAGRIAAIQRRQDGTALLRFLSERSRALTTLFGAPAADPQPGTRAAARQLLRQSMSFLAQFECWAALASITRCAGPYLDRRLLEELYRHTSELVATRRPMEGEAVLGVVLSDTVPVPAELRARFRRRRAQVLAQQGKIAAAQDEFEDLTDCGYPDVEARAVIDLSLLTAGLTSAAQIRLPEGKRARAELWQRFGAVADAVRVALDAIPADGGAVARADGLSFLAVETYLRWAGHGSNGSRPSPEDTLQAVEAALLAIPKANAESQYRLGGTLGLLLTIEATLSFERADVGRGMAAWKHVPHETGRLPLDDLHALVETAMIVDSPSAEWIVDSILRHRPASEVRKPDREWLAASSNLRRSHCEAIEQFIATAPERLDLYENLLAASRRAADREIALRCLDEIYSLGVFEGQTESVLQRLAQADSWDGLWTRAEAHEALADLCMRRKRKDEALLYLEDSFEAAMLAGDLDYASALLARMQEIGLPDAEYNARAARLPAAVPATETLSDSIAKHVGKPIRIAFVGGDERQAQYDDELRAMLRDEFKDLVQVEFIHPGWSSNWGRSVDEVLRQCESRDAVVLMKFIRTLMGRTLRERLSRPWVSCSGHGRKSIYLAILQAVQVVARQKARGARTV